MATPSLVRPRYTCRICHSREVGLVLDYGEMPLAGGFVEAGDPRADWVFPLSLGRCSKCSLMQTLQDIDPEVLFSQYSYSSSSSVGLVSHFEQLALDLTRSIDLTGRLCIDVGCNDGVLLRPLRRYRARVLGVDPSDVARKSGQRFDFPVVNEYLTAEVGRSIRSEYGIPRVITACNVLAHTSNPHSIVEGLRELAGPETWIVIEVHYQGSLLKGTQYDTVYHEHTCYYSVAALNELLKSHGLQIGAVQVIPNHGGSIRVVAGLKSNRPEASELKLMIALEKESNVEEFAEKSKLMRLALIEEVRFRRSEGKRVFGYGASGRGTILLNWCGFTPEDVELVVDRSPLRFGKIVPGVKIPIVPVEGQFDPDIYLLTAWNYADSIKSQHPLYRGQWLAPLPEVGYV